MNFLIKIIIKFTKIPRCSRTGGNEVFIIKYAPVGGGRLLSCRPMKASPKYFRLHALCDLLNQTMHL